MGRAGEPAIVGDGGVGCRADGEDAAGRSGDVEHDPAQMMVADRPGGGRDIGQREARTQMKVERAALGRATGGAHLQRAGARAERRGRDVGTDRRRRDPAWPRDAPARAQRRDDRQ